MNYDHNLRETLLPNTDGYYAVFINTKGQYRKHVVRAKSDFDAALKVKKTTGIMASNEDDVVGPLPSFSHGYDKVTRQLWLGK